MVDGTPIESFAAMLQPYADAAGCGGPWYAAEVLPVSAWHPNLGGIIGDVMMAGETQKLRFGRFSK